MLCLLPRLRDRKRTASSRETDAKHTHKVSGKRRRRKSYSPMKKRRRDSPSHLEARRITRYSSTGLVIYSTMYSFMPKGSKNVLLVPPSTPFGWTSSQPEIFHPCWWAMYLEMAFSLRMRQVLAQKPPQGLKKQMVTEGNLKFKRKEKVDHDFNMTLLLLGEKRHSETATEIAQCNYYN